MRRRSTCLPEPIRALVGAALLCAACSPSAPPQREVPPEVTSEPAIPGELLRAGLLAGDGQMCTVGIENRVGEAVSSQAGERPLAVDLDAATEDEVRLRIAIGGLEARVRIGNNDAEVLIGPLRARPERSEPPPDALPGTVCATVRIEDAPPDQPPADAARAVLAAWSAASTHELLLCSGNGLRRWTIEQRIGAQGARRIEVECPAASAASPQHTGVRPLPLDPP